MENIKYHYIYNIPISILYFLFFFKIIEVLNTDPKIYSLCSNINTFVKKDDDIYVNDLSEEYNEETDKDLVKFVMLMVVGTIGIVITNFIRNKSPGLGIAIGSLLLLSYAIILYWNKMNDITKLIITGLTLSILIYKSYNNEYATLGK